jgi:hypothetical protein
MPATTTPKGGVSRIAIVAAFSGLALSACQPSNQSAAVSSAPSPLAAIPLAASAAPPIAAAPAVAALPSAPRANVGRLARSGDRYAFADAAYAMESAFGDAPPDYTFDYGGGQRPWVWRADDQSTCVAEPLPGGGYRYYYYEPGAQTPYLVRDTDFSYGYDNGVLVVVYDDRGQALQQSELYEQADIAGRILARAQAIYLASQREEHEAVAEANWAARRSQIDAERAQWAADQVADEDWQAYHAEHAQQEQTQWADEQYRRDAQAARFAQTMNDAQLAAQDWQAAQQAGARAAAARQQTQSSAPPGSPFGFKRQPQAQPPAPPQQVQTPVPQTSLEGPVTPAAGNLTAQTAARNAAAARAAAQAQLAAQAAAAQAQAAKLAALRQEQAQVAAAQAQAQHQAQLAAQVAAARAQAAKLAALQEQQAQIAAAQAQAQHQAQLAAQAAAARAQAAKLAALREQQAQIAAAQAQAQHQAQLAAQAAAAHSQTATLAAERQAQLAQQPNKATVPQAKTPPQSQAVRLAHKQPPANTVESGQPVGAH